MPKNTILSRFFPATHNRKGEQTFFVEKFLNGLNYRSCYSDEYLKKLLALNPNKSESLITDFWDSLDPDITDQKLHTIRLGNGYKDGELRQMVVWADDVNPKSGRSGSYQSQQIKIWEPVKIFTQSCEISQTPELPAIGIENKWADIDLLSKNDGLSKDDFYSWFKKAEGPAQIIHFTNFRY